MTKEDIRQCLLIVINCLLGIADSMEEEDGVAPGKQEIEAWYAMLASTSEETKLRAAIKRLTNPRAERLYLAIEAIMVRDRHWKAVEAAWHDLRQERRADERLLH